MIIYTCVFSCGIFLRSFSDFSDYINEFPTLFIIYLNFFSLLVGLPLSLVFDLVIIDQIGFIYVIFSPILIGLITCMHVIYFRNAYKKNLIKAMNSYLKNKKLIRLIKFYNIIKSKKYFILIIRSFPIFPFLLGSYFISLSNYSLRDIFTFSVIGTYAYYMIFYFLQNYHLFI